VSFPKIVGSTGSVPPNQAGSGAAGTPAGSDRLGGGLIVPPPCEAVLLRGEAGQAPESTVDHALSFAGQPPGLTLFIRAFPVAPGAQPSVGKNDSKRNVPGLHPRLGRVSDGEESRQLPSMIGRWGEWRSSECAGPTGPQRAKLPGGIKACGRSGIVRNDESGFTVLPPIGYANTQPDCAAGEDEMPLTAMVERGKRLRIDRELRGKSVRMAFNEDGRGQTLRRPVRGSGNGICVGPERESSSPSAGPGPPVRPGCWPGGDRSGAGWLGGLSHSPHCVAETPARNPRSRATQSRRRSNATAMSIPRT
jgi:hypothetical protein